MVMQEAKNQSLYERQRSLTNARRSARIVFTVCTGLVFMFVNATIIPYLVAVIVGSN